MIELAVAVGFVLGGVIGFVVGVDAGAAHVARCWLTRHPGDAEIRVGARGAILDDVRG